MSEENTREFYDGRVRLKDDIVEMDIPEDYEDYVDMVHEIVPLRSFVEQRYNSILPPNLLGEEIVVQINGSELRYLGVKE